MTSINRVNSSNIRKLWMPLQKASDNSYNGILSDTSLDRDNEKMSPDLLKKWAETNLNGIPTLLNHENKMQNIAGGWKDLKVVSSELGDKQALVGNFHAIKSNPHTKWVPAVIEDMEKLGLPVGVSITAIPLKSKKGNLEKDGYEKMWLDAELVEATLVPIQSNRGSSIAGYKSIAKSFNLLEKSCSSIDDENHQEVIRMTEEIKKEVPESPEEIVEEPKEEVIEKDTEEVNDEEVPEEEPNPMETKMAELEETLAKQANHIKKLKKDKEDELKKADLKGNFEQTSVEKTPSEFISKDEYPLIDMLSL